MNNYRRLVGHLSAPPFQGFFTILTLNPGLAPWANLLDPSGVLTFATEISSEISCSPVSGSAARMASNLLVRL